MSKESTENNEIYEEISKNYDFLLSILTKKNGLRRKSTSGLEINVFGNTKFELLKLLLLTLKSSSKTLRTLFITHMVFKTLLVYFKL